jgi:hypothetical protein
MYSLLITILPHLLFALCPSSFGSHRMLVPKIRYPLLPIQNQEAMACTSKTPSGARWQVGEQLIWNRTTGEVTIVELNLREKISWNGFVKS